MRHIFLTGDIQVGKSTLVRRVLNLYGETELCGFRTVSGAADADGARPVLLFPFGAADGVCVGLRRPDGITAFPERFDTAGVTALFGAESARLIVMDEIGRMERDADIFSARIRSLLRGTVPILGIVQKRADTPLAEEIRRRFPPIEVTPQNRDALVPILVQMLRETD